MIWAAYFGVVGVVVGEIVVERVRARRLRRDRYMRALDVLGRRSGARP